MHFVPILLLPFFSGEIETDASAEPSAFSGMCIVPVKVVCSILQLLHSYLLDKNLRVICIAQQTAFTLLLQPAGQVALDHMNLLSTASTAVPIVMSPAATAVYHLQGFMPKPASHSANTFKSALVSYVDVPNLPDNITGIVTELGIQGADLWTAPAPPAPGALGEEMTSAYNAWLCKLVPALLSVASDPVLRSLQPLVGRRFSVKSPLCLFIYVKIKQGGLLIVNVKLVSTGTAW